jgi:hypothetical protein
LLKIKSNNKKIDNFFIIILIIMLLGIIITNYWLNTYKCVTAIKGKGVGIYWDKNCDNPITSINWGSLTINRLNETNKNETIFVRNEQGQTINLSMNTSYINPTNFNKYIKITWNYKNQQLQPMEIVEITLNISINANILFEIPQISKYEFMINISALE